PGALRRVTRRRRLRRRGPEEPAMEQTVSPPPSVPLAPPPPAPAAAPARPRRRFPWLLVLGVLLLLGTATGARLAMNAGGGDNPKQGPPPAGSPGTRQVAIAYVDVESGLTPLYPVQPGRVTEVLLEENKVVEAGTPLFRVNDTLAKDAVAQAKIDLKAAETRLKQARRLPKQHAAKVGAQKVLRSQLSVGQVLGRSPTQPVVLFCPAVPYVVRAEVEQEFAGRVAEGQKALIQDDATGGGSWTGRVKSISGWYSHRRSMLLEPP